MCQMNAKNDIRRKIVTRYIVCSNFMSQNLYKQMSSLKVCIKILNKNVNK